LLKPPAVPSDKLIEITFNEIYMELRELSQVAETLEENFAEIHLHHGITKPGSYLSPVYRATRLFNSSIYQIVFPI